ncbi:hypothetical protein MRB53_019627 [Persea americana]|uniref:Uncharacterized protein n=1 Tax=Persea americana TaxID=3435 RepID=A0ACC2KZ41_PERAE|nr:hypothetical protein MRB53_019627 [Persea americana]
MSTRTATVPAWIINAYRKERQVTCYLALLGLRQCPRWCHLFCLLSSVARSGGWVVRLRGDSEVKSESTLFLERFHVEKDKEADGGVSEASPAAISDGFGCST